MKTLEITMYTGMIYVEAIDEDTRIFLFRKPLKAKLHKARLRPGVILEVGPANIEDSKIRNINLDMEVAYEHAG
jgi:hypothetical protein